MLEVVKFNNKLYRYREEDKYTLLLYNLRNGSMYFFTGNAKNILQEFDTMSEIQVETDEKIIQLFIMIKAIIK